MFPGFSPRRYFSHLLIIVCILVTVASSFVPYLGMYGMNIGFLQVGMYGHFLLQLIFFQFLHGGILHLLMNSYFLYQIGPEVEMRMTPKQFRIFFVLNTFFTAGALLIFAPNVSTIGISGFAMAILAYLYADLLSVRHPQANSVGFLLILNILIGLSATISLTGHTAGAIFGLFWWYVTKKGTWESLRAS